MEAGYQTPSEESLVILKYLEGKSMDKIVNETKISKGKVHYIIKDWKNKLGTASADQIIDLTRLVKKSGITVEQCTEGFRMINILKDLGIEYNSGFTDDENQYNDNDNDGLLFFIEQIYTNCKKLRIPPAIIPLWIKDLLDFQTFITMDKTDGQQDQYNISIQESYIQRKEQQNLNEFNTPIDIREEAEFKSIIGNKKSGQDIEYPTSDFDFNQTDSSFSSEIKIPFVSQVSFFISQKRKENER
ncbi:MAG: hypothetical protein ACTHJ7_05500, partial [Candidatus Nitrosocosmicus sp.]